MVEVLGRLMNVFLAGHQQGYETCQYKDGPDLQFPLPGSDLKSYDGTKGILLR